MEITHPGATELIDRGVLGVARSLIPGSLSDVDRTMEETFMKFAKGSGTFCILSFSLYFSNQRINYYGYNCLKELLFARIKFCRDLVLQDEIRSPRNSAK